MYHQKVYKILRTDEHILEVETQTEEMAMDWPRKVKHALHVNYDK